MLVRLLDHLKLRGVTAFFVSLTAGGSALERTDAEVSSLIDTWLLLRDIELNGERTRGLHVLKSRGMAHSRQIREFVLTDSGVELCDVYVGPGGVLTGSARLTQEAREEAERLAALQEVERQERALARKREALESQIAALRAGFAADEAEAERALTEGRQRAAMLARDREAMARARQADEDPLGDAGASDQRRPGQER